MIDTTPKVLAPAEERQLSTVEIVVRPDLASPVKVGEFQNTFSSCKLARTVVASFRTHGHISNVLTHISGAKWDNVESALCSILNTATTRSQLSPLAENIVDLLCADSGPTGRIVRPHFSSWLSQALPPAAALHLRAHVTGLFAELTCRRADECDRQR